MADILICHLPEDEAAATRLADAVDGAGYAATRIDAPADDLTDRVGAAPATIVLWSEAAAGSEWIRAEANVARGLKRLVQVSADGRPPPTPFDPGQPVSILTWQGEADHPAWRGIAEKLAALCGPPAAPPEKAEPPATAPEPTPAPAPPPPAPAGITSTPSRGPNPLLIIGLVVLVLVALAAGWFVWRDRTGVAEAPAPSLELNGVAPAPAEPAPAADEIPPPAPPPQVETFDRQAEISDPAGYAVLRNAPSALGFAVARLAAGDRVATYAQSGAWWRVRTAAGETGYLPASSLTLSEAAAVAEPPAPPTAPVAQAPPAPRPRAEPRRPRSRIRKENSEVMLAFCENAGRGTRECRRFRQLER